MSAIPPVPPAPSSLPPYEPGSDHAFTIGDAFSVGWAAMTAQYGSLLLGSIIFLGIQLGASLVGMVLPGVNIVIGLFIAPLAVSLSYMYVRAVRGIRVEPAEIFNHLKVKYWNLVLLQLILLAVFLLLMVPVGIIIGLAVLLGAALGNIAGVIVAVVVGIAAAIGLLIVGVRLGYAGLLYLDAPFGSLEIIEALKVSWRRTAPYALALIGMGILLGLIAAISTLLLCVGAILFGVPFALAVNAAAYDLICPRQPGLCAACGYDCRNIASPTCPECGAPITAAPPPA